MTIIICIHLNIRFTQYGKRDTATSTSPNKNSFRRVSDKQQTRNTERVRKHKDNLGNEIQTRSKTKKNDSLENSIDKESHNYIEVARLCSTSSIVDQSLYTQQICESPPKTDQAALFHNTDQNSSSEGGILDVNISMTEPVLMESAREPEMLITTVQSDIENIQKSSNVNANITPRKESIDHDCLEIPVITEKSVCMYANEFPHKLHYDYLSLRTLMYCKACDRCMCFDSCAKYHMKVKRHDNCYIEDVPLKIMRYHRSKSVT